MPFGSRTRKNSKPRTPITLEGRADDELISRSDLCRFCNDVSPQTMRNKEAEDELTPLRFGGPRSPWVFYRIGEVRRLLKKMGPLKPKVQPAPARKPAPAKRTRVRLKG